MPALLRRYPIISGRGCVLDAAAHATSCQFSRLHCPVMMLCGSSDCTSRYIITLSASVSPNWEGSKPPPTLAVAINSKLTLVFSQLGKLESSGRPWRADTATTSCLPFRPLLSIKTFRLSTAIYEISCANSAPEISLFVWVLGENGFMPVPQLDLTVPYYNNTFHGIVESRIFVNDKVLRFDLVTLLNSPQSCPINQF